MSAAPPLRIAALGLGWVSCHRHIPALLRSPLFKLVGAIDRHEGLAERIAKKHALPFFAQASALDEVPWLNQVDALSIAAPPMAHAPLVLQALAKGKHVLVEKPFALSLEEGEAMVAAAKTAGKTLCIVHNFQFGRAAQKLRHDIESGTLGTVRRIAATQLGNPLRRLPVWYEQLPLGLFYDESPHFFYLLQALAGGSLSLVNAKAMKGREGKNTPALAHLLYEGREGLPVTIDCDFESAVSEWHLRVSGEKAVGIVDIFRDIYIRLPNDGAHDTPRVLGTSLAAISGHILQHIPNGLALLRGRLDYGNDEVVRRFAAAALSGEPDILIDARRALAVLKMQTEAVTALTESL